MAQVKYNGGKKVFGWELRHDPNIDFVEAIFHCVWKSPEGKLCDITPRAKGEKRIMFIEDLGRVAYLTTETGKLSIMTYNPVVLMKGKVVSKLEKISMVSDFSMVEKHNLLG